MPEEKPSDDVEKVLSDLKSIEDRKQALIDDSAPAEGRRCEGLR